mmetsp:Transcript_10630/g.30253  ORF Transcript_10630/g.30253 Transcript_10630/m.30253 type:complete len:170 (+) Transcript_10630:99-608(+)
MGGFAAIRLAREPWCRVVHWDARPSCTTCASASLKQRTRNACCPTMACASSASPACAPMEKWQRAQLDALEFAEQADVVESPLKGPADTTAGQGTDGGSSAGAPRASTSGFPPLPKKKRGRPAGAKNKTEKDKKAVAKDEFGREEVEPGATTQGRGRHGPLKMRSCLFG